MKTETDPRSMDTGDRIFWPRTSEAVVWLGEKLMEDPERPLTDQDKKRVLEFEADLFAGRYSAEIYADGELEELRPLNNNSVQLVPEYLAAADDSTRWLKSLGVLTEDERSIEHQILALPFESLQDADNQKSLETMQKKSLAYLKSRYVSMAQEKAPHRDIEVVTLIKDPSAVFGRATALRSYKQFLQEVRKDLRSQDQSDLVAAKLMITDIYRDKINSQIASLYPSILQAMRQYEAAGQVPDADETAAVGIMLKTAEAARGSADLHSQFLRMLDYVRNGAAVDDDGRMSPIDEQIFTDLQTINQSPGELDAAYFRPEEIAEFEKLVFDSEMMQAFLEAYLERSGLKMMGWGVATTAAKTFSVSGSDREIRLPESYGASVLNSMSSAGVVGITEHEVGGRQPGHVIQSVNAESNPLQLKIAQSPSFRGKRFLSMREAGGTHSEAEAAKFYFGRTRRATGSYAYAMKTLLEGGSHASAVRSFALAQLGDQTASDEDIQKAFQTGADRVMRLLRFGGLNSQPLQYIEAATVRRVAESLPKDTVDMMFAEAVFDPVDMIRLHKFGLLEAASDHRFIPDRPAEEIMAELLKEQLAPN